MNNKINRVLQVAGIGIIGIVLLVLAVAIFFHFIDRVVYVKNDTPEGVEVTMLLQNHDDNGFYLSQTLQIESGAQIKENIGFESVRCLYVSTQGNESSSVFDADRYDVNDDAPPHIDIDVSALVSSEARCPVSRAEFQEGVHNRVKLSRDKWPK